MRDAGLDVVLHCAAATGIGRFKSQMKRADGSGAAYAVIIGEDEIAQGTAVVKEMRNAEAAGNQASVPFEGIADYLVDQIVGAHDHSHDEHVHYHH
ncbi:Histidine--tRNA ligase [compost metagenome]